MKKQESLQAQYDKMTLTPIPKLIISLGIPTIISMLVTSIYNMADTYFVGKIGTSASGAVGVVFGLMAIIQAFGFMFGHGSGSIIARKLGEKKQQDASIIMSTGFVCSGIAGVLITVFGLLFLKDFMRVLGSTETILPYAMEYAKYILMAAPFMAASCVLNNVLRYEGKAMFAMVGLTTGGVLNIFLDWILMNKIGMGVEGAGIATAFSQLISFFILLYMVLSGHTQSKLNLKLLKMKYISDIMIIGLPSLIRQGLGSISTMILNHYAGNYTDAAVAAMAIVNRICFFVFAVGLGLGQGFQPVCAFNYGAKKYDRVKKSVIFTIMSGLVLIGSMAGAGIIMSQGLIRLFRDDPNVIEIGTFALRVQLFSEFLLPVNVTGNMLFQSAGISGKASFLSSLRNGLCFIPVLIVLSSLMGLTGIQISQAVADCITFIITLPMILDFMKKLEKS